MKDLIDKGAPELTEWRRHLHRHPELAYEERETSRFVAEKLRAFGIETHEGLGGTGVVGVIRAGEGGNRAIGLRADMDALPITEATGLPYASENDGRMHACGHDGHTTMLLGAARYLAETRNFTGTVYLIFQPAEENGAGGGRAMIDDGLFQRFPAEAVYGLHNWPGLAPGAFSVRPGAMMASMDTFDVTVTGKGAHAAMPDQGRDPVVAASSMVGELQTVVSRAVAATDAVVVSITQVHAGDAYNVIPDRAMLGGTLRALDETVRARAADRLERIISGVAVANGVEAALDYRRDYPVTLNSEGEAVFCRDVAAGMGLDCHVLPPSMGSEDFAFMLEEKPGAYVWLGNGSSEGGRNLHSPHYDFNDELLPIGASYWAELVERKLSAGG